MFEKKNDTVTEEYTEMNGNLSVYSQIILLIATFMISFLRGYFLILPLHTSTNVPLATRSTSRTSLRAISHCCFSRPYSLGWNKIEHCYKKRSENGLQHHVVYDPSNAHVQPLERQWNR